MIHILGQVPKAVAVAVSGGADSMAALDFFRRSRTCIALPVSYTHLTLPTILLV